MRESTRLVERRSEAREGERETRHQPSLARKILFSVCPLKHTHIHAARREEGERKSERERETDRRLNLTSARTSELGSNFMPKIFEEFFFCCCIITVSLIVERNKLVAARSERTDGWTGLAPMHGLRCGVFLFTHCLLCTSFVTQRHSPTHFSSLVSLASLASLAIHVTWSQKPAALRALDDS